MLQGTDVLTHKSLAPIDIAIILAYFVVVFAIGFYFSLKERLYREAFTIRDGQVMNGDIAYPMLIVNLLPSGLMGAMSYISWKPAAESPAQHRINVVISAVLVLTVVSLWIYFR